MHMRLGFWFGAKALFSLTNDCLSSILNSNVAAKARWDNFLIVCGYVIPRKCKQSAVSNASLMLQTEERNAVFMFLSCSCFHHHTGNPVCRKKFSVLVSSTVGVATETVDARDDTVSAGGTLGQRTLDGSAVVADTERVVADADERAIF